jgi:hypothetical protein
MLKRALLLTTIAVALSAAGALAVAPGFARAPHFWGLGSWSVRGFTPVPRQRDTSAMTHDPAATQSEGGIPGTYCPIKVRDTTAAGASSDAGGDASSPLAGIRSGQSKPGLGSPAPAMCPVPATTTPSKSTFP